MRESDSMSTNDFFYLGRQLYVLLLYNFTLQYNIEQL